MSERNHSAIKPVATNVADSGGRVEYPTLAGPAGGRARPGNQRHLLGIDWPQGSVGPAPTASPKQGPRTVGGIELTTLPIPETRRGR